MEKSKLSSVAIIGLLLINMATLGFLFLSGPKERNHPPMDRMRPKEMIVEKLHFDENQQKEFQKLIDWHKNEIRKNDEEIKASKIALYALLSKNELDTNAKDSLIHVINTHQKEIENVHFKHFEDIKKLCKPEQIDDFNNLSKELARMFAPNKPPRGRND